MAPSRSKSAKKQSPLELVKADVASKQALIEDLQKQIDDAKRELCELENEVKILRGKLFDILPEILTHRDMEKFPMEPLGDLVDADAEYVREMVYMLVDDMYIKHAKRSLVEQRLEDLETKVTTQSLSFQNIVRKNLSCMNKLEEALESSSEKDIKRILKQIKIELAANAQESGVTVNSLPPIRQLRKPRSKSAVNSYNALEIIKEMEETPFTMCKPIRRQSGDTHIRYLVPEIKTSICNELSLEKSTGGDWRMFALKVGISLETIEFWKRLKVRSPMDQVFLFWKDSKAATVRMLYRHLKDPQINALIPAKILCDFYAVD